ncbi:vacuolar fusion protein ccz1 [Linnemannia gamsii]|uniref:Vacuolar fusion protein ccz1 n=1 Tax=Linnemannia gamsii TaxID=64522 RepID=A0ABQ7KC17_9FUNG|nr:vacuolar fusion protein ccz1 [Linnemannia gamsii]
MYGSSAAAAATASSSPSASSPSPTSSGNGLTTSPASLNYFCIYNPDFGPTDETQHEQLLYYVARKTVSVDAKMRNIGLAQGLVNFARIFSPTAPCENVHSQKNRLVFYEAEPGYWLNLSIELGTVKRTVKGTDGKPRVITEYLEHEVHDTVVSALLRQAYAMFRVTHGTMESLVHAHEGNTRPLQRRLEEFFESWVLGWEFDRTTMNLEKALDGIQYLPLNRTSYLSVDRLVQAVKENYRSTGSGPVVTHSMVTFEDQLVSSDVRDEDLRAVWKQVVQTSGFDGASAQNYALDRSEAGRKSKTSTFKFGKSWSNTSIFGFYKSSSSTSTPPSTPPLKPTSRVSSPAPSIRSIDGINTGNTLSGALGSGASPRASGESEAGLTSGVKAQANPLWFGEYIASEDVDEHVGITLKHKSGLNLCFFVPVLDKEGNPVLEDQESFMREMEEFIAGLVHDAPLLDPTSGSGETSRSLLEDVARQVVKDALTARGLGGMISNDKEIRFLYFNRMNLAIKAQLGTISGAGKNSSSSSSGAMMLGSEVAMSLLDIKQDFDRMPDATEITTRSPSNYWIVGKRFEDREVYMIVSRKDSTLVEVEDEVRKLTSLYFNNNTLSAYSHAPSSGTGFSSTLTVPE